MRHIALILLFALAPPAAADECKIFRDSLAVFKATSVVYDAARRMGQLGTNAFDMDQTTFALRDTVRATINAADAAANEAIRANNAALSPLDKVAIDAATNTRDAMIKALPEVILSVSVRDMAVGGEALDDARSGYYDLILVTACR